MNSDKEYKIGYVAAPCCANCKHAEYVYADSSAKYCNLHKESVSKFSVCDNFVMQDSMTGGSLGS